MSSEIELRRWLHREDKTHIENIEFGIKVWNSIEFNLLTKHEIITQEFCNILPSLVAELRTDQEINAAWAIINEFLALKCSPGAVVSSVKMTLITTVSNIVKQMKCPRYIVYRGLIALLQNSSIQSFFKSNSKAFAKLIGACFGCLEKLLDTPSTDSGFDVKNPLNVEVLKITRNYIKQTPFLNEFRKPFVKYLLLPLTEFFLSSRKHGIDDCGDFFNILHEIYFAENAVHELMSQPENSDFAFLFDVPIHAMMLIIEGVLQPLKIDSATQALFIQHLFSFYFNESSNKFPSEKQMLLGLAHFLKLLKRNDVSLNFTIGESKAINYIGNHIDSLNVTEGNLYEILSVLCASIELNAMMLEHTIIPIVIKCMLHRKDDRTMRMFERFLILVIDMYRRLSRSEKFISNLTRSMWQKLSDFKLSKKLKRKLGTVDADMSIDGIEIEKKAKLDGVAEGRHDISFKDSLKEDRNQKNMKLFYVVLGEPVDDFEAATIQKQHLERAQSWKNIQFAWPNTVGDAFSKFISGTVSKPSLVVWKTLIFTITDYIKLIKDSDFSENTLFLIEWTSALLSQYFHGCRLVEQSNNTWDLIESNRKLQRNLLKDFGTAILSQEHNIRTMNAFLCLCYSSGNFDLLLWCYRPDSITNEQIERSMGDNTNDFIHSYLQSKEWGLIEQRITNFGKHECRANLNRLYIQKIKSKLMFRQLKETIDLSCNLLATTLGDDDGTNELNDILVDETINQWFIEQLTRPQKIFTARRIVEIDCSGSGKKTLTSILVRSIKDQEFFDILTVSVFERIAMDVQDPNFILKNIKFDDLFACNDSICKDLIRAIRQSKANSPTANPQSCVAFQLLDALPLGFVSLSLKNILLHLTLGLMSNTSKESVNQSFRHVKKLLLYGETPDVFQYLKVKQFPVIFTTDITESNREVVYQLIFEKSLSALTPSTMKMLEDLLELLKNEKVSNLGDFSFMDLGTRMLEYLSKNKTYREYSVRYRDVILHKIREFFDAETSIPMENEQHFVSITASGFVNITMSMLSRESTEIDDGLKRISKIYLRNMQKGCDSHSIKLLNLLSINKATLGYTDDDIAEVVNKFWNQFKTDLKHDRDPHSYEPFLKFFVNFKSAEELIDMLTEIQSDVDANIDEKYEFTKFNRLFRILFKCQMNKAKGSICSEFFRRLAFEFILKMRTIPQSHFSVHHQILECQKLLCANVQLPVSTELIDDIISFMSETMKCQQIKTTTDASMLKETHTIISDLCYTLIQHRHFFIVDRIPQFVSILKELLQSICWYKCNRSNGKDLEDDEVTMLADLSHNSENIVKALVKHAQDVKRVAPYLLLFMINLMISKENASTIYPKIKTHFDYICYDLISVCDHHVERFIMRNCNEASKQVYESMVKEYNKYHKFKGKV